MLEDVVVLTRLSLKIPLDTSSLCWFVVYLLMRDSDSNNINADHPTNRAEREGGWREEQPALRADERAHIARFALRRGAS